jgi:flagellar basal-body rod protein FlgB
MLGSPGNGTCSLEEDVMPSLLFDPTTRGLAAALTLREQRHEVLASNLANVETPGYRAKELEFKTALQEVFAATAADEPRQVTPSEDGAALPRADGNTVDLDIQMAKLAENGTSYVALARVLGHRVTLLRQAIEGR